MEQDAPSNLLAQLLVNEAAGLSFTALARKLQLSHNGRLVAVFGAAEGQQTLKVIHDKPYLCTLCGACFTHTTQLRCHAQAKHNYMENMSSGGGSLGLERDLDISSPGPASTVGQRRLSSETNYSDANLNSESSELLKSALASSDSLPSFSEVEMKKAKRESAVLSDGEVETDREGCTGDLPECTHCSKSFVGQKNLEAHDIKHCGKEMHKCSACKIAYVPKVIGPSTSEDRPEEAVNQQYLMNSEGSNFTHNHDEGDGAKVDIELEDGQGIDCVLCGETFGILQHIITHIHAYTSFPCTFCDGEFPSMRDLGWHCKQKHDLLLVRCPFCSRGFREYSHLAFHMREHKGHLFCKICKVQCLSRNSYNKHLEIHEMNTGELEELPEEGEDDESDEMSEGSSQKEKEKHTCHICSKPFNSFYSIFHHMRREHPMESLPSYNQDLIKRRFVCKKCGFAFRRKDTLERHELIHKRGDYPRRRPPSKPIIKPRPGNILCTICNRAFSRATNLEAHMEEAHPEECDDAVKGKKKYCCDLCGKLLMSQKSLDRHILVHQEPKFTCPICDKKLKHAETLKTHMRTHTGEKPYNCDICNQSFAQRSTYVQHMCIHSGERPHECDICNKKFIRRTELRVHQAKHTSMRLFPCSHCSKTFKTEKHRKIHETQLHSANAQSYMCEKCGKSFTWASGLKAHACSHIGEAPYKCQECDKSFSQALFLKRHMHVHTKPFKCEQCYEGFKNKADLKNHTAKMHGSGSPSNQTQSIVPTQVQELISDHSWKTNKMMLDMPVDPNSPLSSPMPAPGPSQHTVPSQIQQPTLQQGQSHSPQVPVSMPTQVQGSIPHHAHVQPQGQIPAQMQSQMPQGQMSSSLTNQVHTSGQAQNQGHVRMSYSNRALMSLPNQASMSLPNQATASHSNQVSLSHSNQIPMSLPNHNPMPRSNQGGLMSLSNPAQMHRMSHTMSHPNQMQSPLTNQMPPSHQGLPQVPHRTQVPNHQAPMSLPHQGQASLPGQVQAPMSGPGHGPGLGQPHHHYLPNPMMQDRNMYAEQQYHVQDSTNQAIAAMLTHMSSL
ncbi:zinc finger protein 91-like [Lytechinus pictus]|uniref:zinc finger protein 91-like n=1 Tax=Lytechinus pictus TaxID=7653 RepID=UPI0030B9E9E4